MLDSPGGVQCQLDVALHEEKQIAAFGPAETKSVHNQTVPTLNDDGNHSRCVICGACRADAANFELLACTQHLRPAVHMLDAQPSAEPTELLAAGSKRPADSSTDGRRSRKGKKGRRNGNGSSASGGLQSDARAQELIAVSPLAPGSEILQVHAAEHRQSPTHAHLYVGHCCVKLDAEGWMVPDSQAPYAERVDCTAGWPVHSVA